MGIFQTVARSKGDLFRPRHNLPSRSAPLRVDLASRSLHLGSKMFVPGMLQVSEEASVGVPYSRGINIYIYIYIYIYYGCVYIYIYVYGRSCEP